jgi:glycosyltransferase involved in cell wall biosynthesis
MFCLDDITVLIVNYRTLELTSRCIESLRAFYPAVRLLLIDNGSQDASTAYIQRLAAEHEATTCLLNPKNHYHGPALDQGLRACHSALAFCLDSDTEVVQGGFLEGMTAAFADPQVYAAGKRVYMDWFGYETNPGTPLAFAYVRPSGILLRRTIYLSLKPFIHHGSPGIRNMRHAQRLGYRLQDYPIQAYLVHLGRGTCSRWGYGLGRKHTIEYLLHRALSKFYPPGS